MTVSFLWIILCSYFVVRLKRMCGILLVTVDFGCNFVFFFLLSVYTFLLTLAISIGLVWCKAIRWAIQMIGSTVQRVEKTDRDRDEHGWNIFHKFHKSTRVWSTKTSSQSKFCCWMICGSGWGDGKRLCHKMWKHNKYIIWNNVMTIIIKSHA